jgi:hypothetical protein
VTRHPLLGERLQHQDGETGQCHDIIASNGVVWVTIKWGPGALQSRCDLLAKFSPEGAALCDTDFQPETKTKPPPLPTCDFPGHPRFRIVERASYTMLVEHKVLGERQWLDADAARRDVAEAWWGACDKYVPWKGA